MTRQLDVMAVESSDVQILHRYGTIQEVTRYLVLCGYTPKGNHALVHSIEQAYCSYEYRNVLFTEDAKLTCPF